MITTVFRGHRYSMGPPAPGHAGGTRNLSPPVVRSFAPGRSGRISLALIVAAGLVLGSSVASADMGGWLRNESIVGAGGCESALNETASEGVRCVAALGLSRLLEEGTRLATEQGKQAFGEHFQVVGNLAWSPNRNGLVGDLDAVFPFSPSAEPEDDSSLFFQQGITRWRDDAGAVRNDLRQGIVRRFRISDAADADILGVSVFFLHGLEHRHQVLVPALDYTGSWGTGSIRYFMPATSWRETRTGYEERALEGAELGLRFALTTTLDLNATGYRWRDEDDLETWSTGARLRLDWRPHSWMNLALGYDGIGDAEESASLLVGLAIPFEGRRKLPRWEGFGFAAGGSRPDASNLWTPMDGVGQIRVAERSVSTEPLVEPTQEVQARFLQDTVVTGESVQVEVSLAAPATEDVRVSVSLVPGSGSNPAVPGVDFVDEPVETTISQGSTSVVVSMPLLHNGDMTEPRPLRVTASVVS